MVHGHTSPLPFLSETVGAPGLPGPSAGPRLGQGDRRVGPPATEVPRLVGLRRVNAPPRAVGREGASRTEALVAWRLAAVRGEPVRLLRHGRAAWDARAAWCGRTLLVAPGDDDEPRRASRESRSVEGPPVPVLVLVDHRRRSNGVEEARNVHSAQVRETARKGRSVRALVVGLERASSVQVPRSSRGGRARNFSS
jgi:hypothetical protein